MIMTMTTHNHDHHHHDHDHGHGHRHHGAEDAHARAHASDIQARFADGGTTSIQTVLFGLTGGLIPCSAAITVLILCLHLDRFWFGIGLVSAFSVGLAATLVAAGVRGGGRNSLRIPPVRAVRIPAASRPRFFRRTHRDSRRRHGLQRMASFRARWARSPVLDGACRTDEFARVRGDCRCGGVPFRVFGSARFRAWPSSRSARSMKARSRDESSSPLKTASKARRRL